MVAPAAIVMCAPALIVTVWCAPIVVSPGITLPSAHTWFSLMTVPFGGVGGGGGGGAVSLMGVAVPLGTGVVGPPGCATVPDDEHAATATRSGKRRGRRSTM